MSILFLPPQSAGSVTIADATETTSGKIRIATSAEATAGTNDVTAMTPAKVKSVIDASLVGGVTYKGTLDASAPADLSNATKGDLYIISVAGTYAGKTWAVGDHLLINADMGGTLDSAKIDKVDNTDAVTSVAGRTGAVTLSTADISGLATVASTGAYSDLSGTPTLATVATTGAYSDLSGTPTLGTAAALDVGTSASNVVQLDGTGKLPAVDGSQLTNLPAPTIGLNDLTDVTFTAGSGIDDFVLTYNNGTGLWGAEIRKSFYLQPYGTTATAAQISDNRSMYYELTASGITLTIPTPSGYAGGGLVIVRNTSAGASSITGPSMMLSDGSVVSTLSLDADDVKIFVWRATFPTAVLHEISTSRLSQIDDVDLTGLGNGDVLVYNSTSGKWEAGSTPATSLALDDLTDVTITGAATGEVLRYDGTAWVDAQLAYSDLSGTPTLATVATTGAYSDLSGTPTLGTAAALDVGTSANNVVQLNGSAQLPAVDGSLLTNLPTGSDSFYLSNVYSTSTAAQISDNRHQTYNINTAGITLTLQNGSGNVTSSPVIGGLVTLINTSSGSVTIASPAGGLGPFFNFQGQSSSLQSFILEAGARLSFVWFTGNSLVERAVSQLGGLTDVAITSAAAGEVLRYDGTAWVDAQLAYSDLSGTPTLATVATTGAYSDLSGTPTLGTAAALDVGTSASNVVQLNGSAQLPAVDGSLLTNLPAPSALYTYSAQSASFTAAAGYHYSLNTSSSALTVTLPAVSTVSAGAAIRIKLKDATNGATLTPNGADTIDGLSSFSMNNTKQSLTLVSDGTSDWEII